MILRATIHANRADLDFWQRGIPRDLWVYVLVKFDPA